MKKYFLLAVVVFINFGGACLGSDTTGAFAVAAQSRNSITGFVYNTSRQPVADVYVELQTDFYSTLARAKTNGSGFFAFRGLSDGRYNVKVMPYNMGYEEQARSISLISVSTGRSGGGITEQVDFYLRVRKDSRSQTPLGAPGVVFVQEVPPEAGKYYEEGIKYLEDKKDVEGFESLKKSLEIFPDYFLALDRLGNEYVRRGYYTASYVLLTKAVAVNPKSFSSTFGLGLTMYRLEEIEKAIENFEKAVEISGESPNAHLWLGIAHLQNKNLSGAETALDKANKLSEEKSGQVYWQLARLYNEQKKYARSADALELFLKYSPEAKDAEKIKQSIETLRRKAAAKQP